MQKSFLTLALAALTGCGLFAAPTPAPTLTPRPTYPPQPTSAPQPTLTPWPTYAPQPTPGPAVDLANLYCQYDFCLSVPAGVYLADEVAPRQWSSAASGVLRGSGPLVMFMLFYGPAAAPWDAARPIATVRGAAEVLGPLVSETMGARTVFYQPVRGGRLNLSLVGAWTCGSREFVAALGADDPAQGMDALRAAAAQFECAGG